MSYPSLTSLNIKRVAVVYSDVKEEYFPTHSQFVTEQFAKRDALFSATVINSLGAETLVFSADDKLIGNLKQAKPDVIFNMACSIKGNEPLSAMLPGLYQMLGIPFTGADLLSETLGYNKFLTKKMLSSYWIPVPNNQLFAKIDQLNKDLDFPIITKLNSVHGVVELTQDAISENKAHLNKRINRLIKTYKQPVIAEKFIIGREFTAFIVESVKPDVYIFENLINSKSGKYTFASFELSWQESDDLTIKTIPYKNDELKNLILRAYKAVSMRGYGKFDIRMDQAGNFYFIDANTNPFLAPYEAECPMVTMLEMVGVSFEEIITKVLAHAVSNPL